MFMSKTIKVKNYFPSKFNFANQNRVCFRKFEKLRFLEFLESAKSEMGNFIYNQFCVEALVISSYRIEVPFIRINLAPCL